MDAEIADSYHRTSPSEAVSRRAGAAVALAAEAAVVVRRRLRSQTCTTSTRNVSTSCADLRSVRADLHKVDFNEFNRQNVASTSAQWTPRGRGNGRGSRHTQYTRRPDLVDEVMSQVEQREPSARRGRGIDAPQSTTTTSTLASASSRSAATVLLARAAAATGEGATRLHSVAERAEAADVAPRLWTTTSWARGEALPSACAVLDLASRRPRTVARP